MSQLRSALGIHRLSLVALAFAALALVLATPAARGEATGIGIAKLVNHYMAPLPNGFDADRDGVIERKTEQTRTDRQLHGWDAIRVFQVVEHRGNDDGVVHPAEVRSFFRHFDRN